MFFSDPNCYFWWQEKPLLKIYICCCENTVSSLPGETVYTGRCRGQYRLLGNRTGLCCQLCITGHTHLLNDDISTFTQIENKTGRPNRMLCGIWKHEMMLTKKGWRGHGSITTGHHDADPSFHEWDGEIDDLRTLLIDRQRSDGHDGFLIDHLGGGCRGRAGWWTNEDEGKQASQVKAMMENPIFEVASEMWRIKTGSRINANVKKKYVQNNDDDSLAILSK